MQSVDHDPLFPFLLFFSFSFLLFSLPLELHLLGDLAFGAGFVPISKQISEDVSHLFTSDTVIDFVPTPILLSLTHKCYLGNIININHVAAVVGATFSACSLNEIHDRVNESCFCSSIVSVCRLFVLR